jgi:eukaryotic-like serine/threonine-protein kinase
LIAALAHFRIIEKIGAGGMGEVYLAEDLRLRRKVALKVLPAELAQHRDRLRRFEQEACAASGLSHPNILVVYEVGEDQGRHYIATEYVEGRTLRRRLELGSLPPGEALDVAIQVASGLAAAHDAGIVHRDIKPENVMVRDDGYVKLVDFGLAKLASAADADGPGEANLTRTDTEPGKVIGTVDYMSPEQARGLPVDARSDIFSLGVVLYEALAGRPPFQGETRSDVLAALLATEAPPLPRQVAAAAGELTWVVGRMLRKDRGERYQTAREVAADLKHARQALERAAAPAAPAPPPPSPPPAWTWRRAGVGAAALLLGWLAYTWRQPWPQQSAGTPGPRLGELVRYDREAGAWRPYLGGRSVHHVDFSRDGRSAVYVDYPEGTLCRSAADGSGRTQLTFAPLRAATPRWSPDGRWIVFVAALPDKPWRIHLAGPGHEASRPLLDHDREERTPGWSPDGRRLVFWVTGDGRAPGLLRILDLETRQESVIPGSDDRYSPRWSPDGRSLLALTLSRSALHVLDVARGRWTEIVDRDVSWPQWSRDGRHIYFQDIDGSGISRVRLADGAIDAWAGAGELRRVPRLEPFGSWLGLAPDDSPLALARAAPLLTERTAARPAP